MSKLEKCREELERARKRYENLGNKIKELEKQYKEQEKVEVHGMMIAAALTPEQLGQLIRMAKTGELYFENMKEKCEEEMFDEE